MEYDVFISYSSKDHEIAFDICKVLEDNGLVCWIAPRNVRGGMSYAREIILAIEASSVTLFIFSKYSNCSAHVENEIDCAFNAGKVIVPFKISDTGMSPELKYYLNKKHWVDGLPEPTHAFESLKDIIIANIPEKAARANRSKSLQVVMEMVEQMEGKTEDSGEAYQSFCKDQDGQDLVKRLDVVKEKIEKIKFNINLGEFIETELKDNETLPEESRHENEKSSPGQRYDLLQNKAGEILLIINHIPGDPENPRLVYDGGEGALLYRNRESAMMLEHLALEAREPLSKVEKILVIEVLNDESSREYEVPVRIVKNLAALGG